MVRKQEKLQRLKGPGRVNQEPLINIKHMFLLLCVYRKLYQNHLLSSKQILQWLLSIRALRREPRNGLVSLL